MSSPRPPQRECHSVKMFWSKSRTWRPPTRRSPTQRGVDTITIKFHTATCHLPTVPGPGPVHHLHQTTPSAHDPPPADARDAQGGSKGASCSRWPASASGYALISSTSHRSSRIFTCYTQRDGTDRCRRRPCAGRPGERSSGPATRPGLGRDRGAARRGHRRDCAEASNLPTPAAPRTVNGFPSALMYPGFRAYPDNPQRVVRAYVSVTPGPSLGHGRLASASVGWSVPGPGGWSGGVEQDRSGAMGGEVAPCPVNEYLETVSEADQVDDVHADPEQPCHQPAKP